MKAICLGLLLTLTSAVAFAGGHAVAAVPTKIDLVRGEGFMLAGAFGNAGGCVVSNHLFVKGDHPQYKLMYAAALAAYAGKQKITAYVHGCEPVLWYSEAVTTYNIVHSNSSLAITD